MTEAQFAEGLENQMQAAPEIDAALVTRLVVMSDLHAGDGSSRDDLRRNGDLLLAVLERHYLERGSALVLNGDIEELQKFGLDRIRAAWAPLFGLLDRFREGSGLYKIYGNHDVGLLEEAGYPYELHPGVKILYAGRLLYAFHGHQASRFFVKYNRASGALVRYFLRPLGIKNLNVSKDSRRKYRIERRIYGFARDRGIAAIIGHTHRPVFESLSKYDRLRFAIEELCLEYPRADESGRARIAATVELYKEEFRRLGRKELRGGRRRNRAGLYGRDLLMPCLFNSGCAVGKKGITALEIEDGRIELVYWFEEGKERRYLASEAAEAPALPGTAYRRAVLGTDRLDYLFARMDLLG